MRIYGNKGEQDNKRLDNKHMELPLSSQMDQWPFIIGNGLLTIVRFVSSLEFGSGKVGSGVNSTVIQNVSYETKS